MKPNGKLCEPLGNESNLIASRRILQNVRPLLVSPIRGNLLKKIVAPVVVVDPFGILPGRSLTIRQRKELYLHKKRKFLVLVILCMRREKRKINSLLTPVRIYARTGR